jgi:hypothetical protein
MEITRMERQATEQHQAEIRSAITIQAAARRKAAFRKRDTDQASFAASKENEAASLAVVQKKASRRPLEKRSATKENATGTKTATAARSLMGWWLHAWELPCRDSQRHNNSPDMDVLALEMDQQQQQQPRYMKPTRPATKRPAHKLSIGLIDTYNCINKVSSQSISVSLPTMCVLSSFFS